MISWAQNLSIAEGRLVADRFADTPLSKDEIIRVNYLDYGAASCSICGSKDAKWYNDPTAPVDEDFYTIDENHPKHTPRCLKHKEPHLTSRGGKGNNG